MVAPAGQVGIQVSRENFAMRRLGMAERASDSMRRHWAALLRCAEAVCLRVQRGGLEMRGVQPQPLEAAVVEVGEDGGDGPASAFLTRGLGAPCTRVEMGE